VIKSIYDKYIIIEFAQDGWVHRTLKAQESYIMELEDALTKLEAKLAMREPDDFDPSEDPIGRG
jgi:hypothetical protein